MAISGLEHKVTVALAACDQSDEGTQQLGMALLDVAKAVEQLSRELESLRQELRDEVE
jgi:hypothetical protein